MLETQLIFQRQKAKLIKVKNRRQKLKKKYVIAGAGFKGFCDALELINMGDCEIHIIDKSKKFGGIMYSKVFGNFAVDLGVHVFDSVPQELANVVDDIMQGQIKDIPYDSTSAFNNKVTEGFSLPDLSHLSHEQKAQICLEIVELAAREENTELATLKDYLVNRYAKTAGNIFCDIFERIYGIAPTDVEPEAIRRTSLGRLKFLGDDEMKVLKSNDQLDRVLAARRQSMGKIDDLVSVYPTDGNAMKGWCDRAKVWLENRGVKISLDESITSIDETSDGIAVTTDKQKVVADKVIWANDNTSRLGDLLNVENSAHKLVHGTSMIFTTFVTKEDQIKDFTYLQNFDVGGVTYRTAAAGRISSQVDDNGMSFITCECPTTMGSDDWNDSEGFAAGAWEECKNLGVIRSGAELVDKDVINIPATFRSPKIGYEAEIDRLSNEIEEKFPLLVFRDVKPFFRRELYLDSKGLPDLLNA